MMRNIFERPRREWRAQCRAARLITQCHLSLSWIVEAIFTGYDLLCHCSDMTADCRLQLNWSQSLPLTTSCCLKNQYSAKFLLLLWCTVQLSSVAWLSTTTVNNGLFWSLYLNSVRFLSIVIVYVCRINGAKSLSHYDIGNWIQYWHTAQHSTLTLFSSHSWDDETFSCI